MKSLKLDYGKLLSYRLKIQKYNRSLLTSDLNSEIGKRTLQEFCNICKLKCGSNKPKFYKNPGKSSCIEILLKISAKTVENTIIVLYNKDSTYGTIQFP